MRHRSFFLLIISFLVSFSLSASEVGLLKGIVFVGEKSLPFKGAKVKIGESEFFTNKDGAYRASLSPGSYVLQIKVSGFKEYKSQVIEIAAGESVEVLTHFLSEKRQALNIIEQAKIVKAKPKAQNDSLRKYKLNVKVISAETKKPVEKADVYVRGIQQSFVTDENGLVKINLATGKWDLTVIHNSFSSANKTDLFIREGADLSLLFELDPAAIMLDDYTLTVPKIQGSLLQTLAERRESSNVADILGADQMSKSGDSDAAGALKRVTGISVVGGKFVYVRGLGERYSSTILNVANIPSPEPEKRVVPLDLFPISLLESISIQKTYSADMPGEFAGGVVQLRTRAFPKTFFAKISSSFGYNEGITFQKNGLKNLGGPTDWLGYDGGFREMPDFVKEAANRKLSPKTRRNQNGFSSEELERIGEALPDNWATYRGNIPGDFGLSGTIGTDYKLFGKKSGFLVSLAYKNAWDKTEKDYDIYTLASGNLLNLQNSYAFEQTDNEITVSGILSTGIELSKNESIQSTTILTRLSSNEIRYYDGYNGDLTGDLAVTRLRWIERMLLIQQLNGNHKLDFLPFDLGVEWAFTYSDTTRKEPDRKKYRYNKEVNDDGSYKWILEDGERGNSRFFSDLDAKGSDFFLKFTNEINLDKKLKLKNIFGGSIVHKDRAVDTRRFYFHQKGPLSYDNNVLTSNINEIFSDENISSEGFELRDFTRSTDNYTAFNDILAGFYINQLEYEKAYILQAGLRVEKSVQEANTFELYANDPKQVKARLENLDFLPAATFTWKLNKELQLRSGYSRTVTRPDFRELSPFEYNDVDGGRTVVGNKDLKRGSIDNADLRAEWYPSDSESVSIAGFFKRFKDPIEKIIEVSSSNRVTFQNAKGARNYGIEFDFRYGIGNLIKDLNHFYLSGNYTLVRSLIELSENAGVQTSNERPLQGQSPFIINLQLMYDNLDSGMNASLLYNVSGRRISETGALGAPDSYEEPFHQLDFVFKSKLAKGLSISAKAKNLLDAEVKSTQGSKVTSFYKKGRSYSLGLSYKF